MERPHGIILAKTRDYFDLEDIRRTIKREACIYVKDRTTGMIAHVWGHSKPAEANPENASDVFRNGTRSWSIVISGKEQLDQVRELVREIKGNDEYDGVWGELGQV